MRAEAVSSTLAWRVSFKESRERASSTVTVSALFESKEVIISVTTFYQEGQNMNADSILKERNSNLMLIIQNDLGNGLCELLLH